MRPLLLAVLALGLSAPAANASSFDGGCDFSGTVTFSPPMTTAPQPVAQSADALGACSGTVVAARGRTRTVASAPARYRAASSGDTVSCAFGVASGSGVLSIGRARIRFAMTEYRGGATPLIRLTGRRGGEAWMAVTPSQEADPIAAVQACGGAGLDSFDLNARVHTIGAIRG